MANIGNYTELKQAVADYLARADLTSFTPDYFINLAEARIKYGSDHPQYPSEPLRIRAMETAVNLSLTQQSVALPTGYLDAIRIYVPTTPIQVLNQVSPTQLYSDYPNNTTGTPVEYAIEGNNFVFAPPPDSSYEGRLLYHKAFDALSATSSTNWLLSNSPGCYLYGALLEAAMFINDDSRMPMFFAMFSAAVNGLQGANKRDRWSGSILVVRKEGVTP